MKALVLKKYNEFSYEEVPMPEVGPEEVLVRVKACAICGSDVHGMDGSTGRRIPPVIMGHEAAGVIEKAGSGVKDFRVGDRVTFDSTISCGKCFFCKEGRVNLCDSRRVLGVSCGDYRQNGAFAQYVAVPERILYRLPDNLHPVSGSLICRPWQIIPASCAASPGSATARDKGECLGREFGKRSYVLVPAAPLCQLLQDAKLEGRCRTWMCGKAQCGG